MQTGIMVVDVGDHIRLMNESASTMLDTPATHSGRALQEVSADLHARLQKWRNNNAWSADKFRSSATSPFIQPRFARLGETPDSAVLIFLEDMSATAQQAQQLKLASLGQLTASIAHEIRNPLGAISHASQLLHESPDLLQADRRLTQIVLDHSLRMNTIIENVMQLSRRDRAEPVLFDLPSWLEEFRHEYLRSEQVDANELVMHHAGSDIPVRMDPSQLHQVVTNLVNNALRHSAAYPGSPKVELRAGQSSDTHAPYLEIIDHGPGISEAQRDHIFEPFYTTESRGTGLGLYISRELCEGNQARLDYIPVAEGGCFRITFADPRRKQTGTI
jgi:two-component system sensor histidine kinase PilS (NtrC family)